MLTIDGSYGEGGGQILRSALALSLATRQPFVMEKIRANRSRPGLGSAHLLAVEAARKVSKARVSGDEKRSLRLQFEPGLPIAGWYELAAGSRGAASHVVQTILPALMSAVGPSVLKIAGGTHIPMAPPVDFLEKSFLPHLAALGPVVKLTLDKPGYFPSGGGHVTLDIEPRRRLNPEPLELVRRGRLLERQARIVIANLNHNTARRQKEAFLAESNWNESTIRIDDIEQPKGPGNMVCVTLRFEHACEVITHYGQIGDPPERIARQAAAEAEYFIESDAAVGEHLADQLLLPMAMAGGGRITTTSPSRHTRTNMHIIEQFLPHVSFDIQPHGDKAWMIVVKTKA